MKIVFYAAPNSSAIPVASALTELGVPHERIDLDLSSGEQRRPEFLALNPNGKVPTLVVDGTPMFEAIAILQWLGERFGVASGHWPAADSPARLRALSWTTWAYVTYGATVHRLFLASHPAMPDALRSEAAAERSRSELEEMLSLLEAQLAGSPYLAGADFGMVDLIVVSVVIWSETVGVSTKNHPAVADWVARCKERPSIRSEWN